MQRKAFIAANWKMNKAPGEAAVLAQDALQRLGSSVTRSVGLAFCPPLVSLASVASVLHFEHSKISLGAQDVFWQDDGAFTGATSARMLAEIGCRYCIVGHSERRYYFAETDEDISLKIAALLRYRITPILCVGESSEVRSAGARLAKRFVVQQLRSALGPIVKDNGSGHGDVDKTGLVVAYEPIWSIGTGQTATPATAQSMAEAIRKELDRLLGSERAEQTPILYGGSLNASNIAPFAVLPDIDGGLVGGVSLQAGEFADLVKGFVKARRAGDSIQAADDAPQANGDAPQAASDALQATAGLIPSDLTPSEG